MGWQRSWRENDAPPRDFLPPLHLGILHCCEWQGPYHLHGKWWLQAPLLRRSRGIVELVALLLALVWLVEPLGHWWASEVYHRLPVRTNWIYPWPAEHTFVRLFQQVHSCRIQQINALHRILVRCKDKVNPGVWLGLCCWIVAEISEGKAPLTSGLFCSRNPNLTNFSRILSHQDQQQHCNVFRAIRWGDPNLPVFGIWSQSC